MHTFKVSFVIIAAVVAMGLNSARADQPHMSGS